MASSEKESSTGSDSTLQSPLKVPPRNDEDIDEDDVEETILERLVGLTEMVPTPVWDFTAKSVSFGYWLTRRSLWVIGTSAALLLLPAFIEQQRQEMLAMQDMQTKQMILGPGQGAMNAGNRPRM